MTSIARRDMMAGLLAIGLPLQGCTSRAAAGLAGPAGAAAPLVVHGATMTVEIAAVLLAVRNLYPDGPPVKLGGVASLVGTETVADVATNAETQALRYSVARPDVRIVMTLVEGHYRIVARRSAGIAALADLRGKRIATLQFTSADYFLAKMLDHAGLTPAEVDVRQVMPLQDMVTGIANHDLDAVAIWEPFSENAVRALGSDAIEFSGKGIYQELFNVNTTAGALADPQKRGEIVRLLRAIIAANEAMNRDPAEGQAAVAASGGYTIEEVRQCWPHHGFVASFADDMLDTLVEEEVWLAGRENRPPRTRAQLAPLIDRSVYEEARSRPG